MNSVFTASVGGVCLTLLSHAQIVFAGVGALILSTEASTDKLHDKMQLNKYVIINKVNVYKSMSGSRHDHGILVAAALGQLR